LELPTFAIGRAPPFESGGAKYHHEHHEREEALSHRLDEEKLEQLQRWGAGLAATEDQELRATGKAILLLIEEIEALHVELWNEKTAPPADEADGDGAAAERSLDRALGARLRRLGRR
jgi:hypothetical protein